MQQTMKKTKILSTSALVKISILSAIGYILMFISIPLPMLFPDFLKIDISDLTALLGGISLGPMGSSWRTGRARRDPCWSPPG